MSFDIANDFFLDFIKALNASGVSYLLIGGYAVNYHGYNRTTADMDIWLKPDNENRDRFITALIKLGFEAEEIKDIAADDFTIQTCYTFGTMPNHVDVLTFVHHKIDFDKAYDTSDRQILDNGEEIRIVSYDILIDIKLRAGRVKDLQDVAQLKEIKDIEQNKGNSPGS